jgi:hypothetical protein
MTCLCNAHQHGYAALGFGTLITNSQYTKSMSMACHLFPTYIVREQYAAVDRSNFNAKLYNPEVSKNTSLHPIPAWHSRTFQLGLIGSNGVRQCITHRMKEKGFVRTAF